MWNQSKLIYSSFDQINETILLKFCSSLETCDFNFFFADHSSLLNPREVALVSSLDLYDKMGQVVQSAIERTNNEGFSTHR